MGEVAGAVKFSGRASVTLARRRFRMSFGARAAGAGPGKTAQDMSARVAVESRLPRRSLLRRGLGLAALALSAPFALVLLYALAALVAALIPLGGRAQADDGPPLFVCASPVHSDIVAPLDPRWRAAFPDAAENLPDRAYLAIGWGDLGFYRDTPQWRDLTLRTALRALAGLGPTTLHVLAVHAPAQNPACARIAVDRAGREALARFILASAENDESGRPRLIASPRWGESFYAARGRYSPWRTCNVWTRDALAAAGLPAAAWAPFSFGVMWPLNTQR